MKRIAVLLAAVGCLGAWAAVAAESAAPLLHARPAWATAENDLGELDPTLRLTHLTILLNRAPDRQAAFDALLRGQQDPQSPNFHRWLTPAQVGEQFGAPDEDLAAVSSWLRSQGLQVDRVANSRTRIEFSGFAADVSSAFRANLHAYLVDGDRRIAPAASPQVPASLSRSVSAVVGLETIRARPHYRLSAPHMADVGGTHPKLSSCSGATCTYYVAPADFATIYDVNPVYQQGISGAGQTIAILGRARVYLPDIENFQLRLGLPAKDPMITLAPNGIDPGQAQSTPPSDATTVADQVEATLDVTRAGSVAQGATINLVISANSATTSGLLIAAEYAIDSAIANIVSVSFGVCEHDAGPSYTAVLDNLYSQAAGEGISTFVSSGDGGIAGCDKQSDAPPAAQFASTNAHCSSGYVVCVGGTQFADSVNPGAYWRSTNSAGNASASGYIPEGAWNEPLKSDGSAKVAATGGGVSVFIPTPGWQTGTGVPGTQGRYTPDVSFMASSHDGYFGCSAASGAPCTLANGRYMFAVYSGTSASAPSMAGIAALLNQKMGSAQGNLNPRLYALAAAASNGVFHDVTVATSAVADCTPDVPSLCNNSMPRTDGPGRRPRGLHGRAGIRPGYGPRIGRRSQPPLAMGHHGLNDGQHPRSFDRTLVEPERVRLGNRLHAAAQHHFRRLVHIRQLRQSHLVRRVLLHAVFCCGERVMYRNALSDQWPGVLRGAVRPIPGRCDERRLAHVELSGQQRRHDELYGQWTDSHRADHAAGVPVRKRCPAGGLHGPVVESERIRLGREHYPAIRGDVHRVVRV